MDDSDDDGSVAGPGESQRPQRADIMWLICQGLFGKGRAGILGSCLAPSSCTFAGQYNTDGHQGDADHK